MNKEKVVITGGQGDIARAIKTRLITSYDVLAPGHRELDVTNVDAITIFFASNKPDILINVAGFIEPQKIIDADFPLWERHIEVNLYGTVYCSVIGLRNGVHKIINIGSSAAYEGKAEWSAYCASKAAVMSFTESLIAEGHDAFCLNIGRTKTKMRFALYGEENPDTLLTPEEIALRVAEILQNKYSERIIRMKK
jgi:NAD(P)-dependent dehydrogenase (short-subunit alcohol dehydrogenase family)